MNNLGLILSVLYPNAAQGDYSVQDDGQGPYIKSWDEAKLGPQPTPEQLAAVDVGKVTHNRKIDAQIAALEASRPGYVRGIREFMLGVAQILAQVPGAPDLSQTPGMRNVKTLDDQIAVLRTQRR